MYNYVYVYVYAYTREYYCTFLKKSANDNFHQLSFLKTYKNFNQIRLQKTCMK
jgi:hypothetical protein